jgi:uncharacterized delta-60 repeat protein
MRFFAFAISLSIGCSGSGSDPAPAAGDAGTIDVGADAQVDMGVPATGPGSLDPTFGTGGVVQRALPESITSFLPRTAVLTPDDGVDFTATYTSGSPGYGLGRIDANGTIDEKFAGDTALGFLRSTFYVDALTVVDGGKLVAIGSGSDAAQAMRILPDGTTDPAFPRTTFFGNVVDHGGLVSAVLDTDGSIVSGGHIQPGSPSATPRVFLGRVTPDAKFTRLGDSTTSYGGKYQAVEPKLRTADGKFLCRARGTSSEALDVIVRIDAMGVIDTTFGTAGELSTPVDYIDVVLPQADGGFLVFGYGATSVLQQSMARLKSDGTIDETFGDKGRVMLPEKESYGSALALQSDGKILVAIGVDVGERTGHTTTVLHRYDTSGALDATFGKAGTAALPFGGVTSTRISSVLVQKSGRIVLVGNTSDAKGIDSFLAMGVRP